MKIQVVVDALRRNCASGQRNRIRGGKAEAIPFSTETYGLDGKSSTARMVRCVLLSMNATPNPPLSRPGRPLPASAHLRGAASAPSRRPRTLPSAARPIRCTANRRELRGTACCSRLRRFPAERIPIDLRRHTQCRTDSEPLRSKRRVSTDPRRCILVARRNESSRGPSNFLPRWAG
jgi:hypothetical protein